MFNALEDCGILSRFEMLERAVRARYFHGFAESGLDPEAGDDDRLHLTRLRLPECQFVFGHEASTNEDRDRWYFQLRWPNGKRRPQLFGNVRRLEKISELQAGWALALSYFRSTGEPTQSRIWLFDDRTLMMVDDRRDEPFSQEEANAFSMIFPTTFGSIGLGITEADLDAMSQALLDEAPASQVGAMR